MGKALEQLTRPLRHERLPIAAGLLSSLLLLPALWGGFQLDDHLQRFRLLGLGDPSIQLFVFYDGSIESNRAQMELGTLPWWASPDLRHANFRYLSVLSMQLDYLLWPDSPVLMHLHSLVWLALCVGVAGVLYRRLFGREASGALWAAGLAALLYAVDDAHSLPAACIANRNALLATFFGLLSLHCHVRWRDDGWRAGGFLAPACLALALLSAELGVSTIALLGAWALVLDRGPWRERLLSLLPHAAVALGWFVVYRMGGFGAQGSGVYVDPRGDPAGFMLGIYWDDQTITDPENTRSDAAIEVPDDLTLKRALGPGIQERHLPGGAYVVVRQCGSASVRETYETLFRDWFPRYG